MEGIDFNSYLAQFGASSDEEDNAELEAELYSQLHYHSVLVREEPQQEGKVLPDFDESVLVNDAVEIVESGKNRAESPTNSGDDDVEIVVEQPTSPCKALNKRKSPDVFENDNVPHEVGEKQISCDDSKYASLGNRKRKAQDTVELSESSDDDSCIQIVSEKRERPSLLAIPNLVDLVESDSSASEVEELPSFFKTPVPPQPTRIVVQEEEEESCPSPKRKKSDVVIAKGNSFNKHTRYRNSSSSSSDSEYDEAILENDIHINVRGYHSGERTFSEATGLLNSSPYEKVKKISKWTPDMHAFYDDIDESMVEITLEKILAGLPDDANWTVQRPHASTRNFTPSRYFHGRKCINCNRDGHNAKSCPEPKRKLVCSMCCEPGHRSYQCPKEQCLRCSASGEPYSENCRKCRYLDTMQCRLCGGCGHIQSKCPDTWRRYHATLDAGEKPTSKGQNQISALKSWCCNCGRQGHYVHQCRGYRFSSLPTPVLSVVSYEEPKLRQNPVEESRSAKKRRLREELRAKRREYLSLPSTPNRNPLEFDQDVVRSYPVTPVTDRNYIGGKVDRTLKRAKRKLHRMIRGENPKKKEDPAKGPVIGKVLKRKLRKKDKMLSTDHEPKLSKKQMRKEIKSLKNRMGPGSKMASLKSMAVKKFLSKMPGI